MAYADKEIKLFDQRLKWPSHPTVNDMDKTEKKMNERMPLYGQYKIEMAWQKLDCQSIMRTFSTDWGTMYLSLSCNHTQRHVRQTDWEKVNKTKIFMRDIKPSFSCIVFTNRNTYASLWSTFSLSLHTYPFLIWIQLQSDDLRPILEDDLAVGA